MSKERIPDSEISIVLPQTPEDMDALADDIRTLAALFPEYDPEFLSGGMREFPEHYTLVYHQDKPVAYIEIRDNTSFEHIGKDSLEFLGVVLPEYRERGLTQQVAPVVIRTAFLRSGKKKMLALISEGEEYQEAQAAIIGLGFRRIGKRDGHLLYKLDRNQALAQANQ